MYLSSIAAILSKFRDISPNLLLNLQFQQNGMPTLRMAAVTNLCHFWAKILFSDREARYVVL